MLTPEKHLYGGNKGRNRLQGASKQKKTLEGHRERQRRCDYHNIDEETQFFIVFFNIGLSTEMENMTLWTYAALLGTSRRDAVGKKNVFT
jgi:hypothetical protein